MKPWIPNALSASRILGSVLLLFTGGLTPAFLVLFAACSLTDLTDGWLARRHGLCSPRGEILDSLADLALVLAMLAVLIPVMPWEPWMIALIIAIASLRVVSASIGYRKYGKVALIHTMLNKAGGLLIRLAPYLLLFLELGPVVAAVCSVSLAGALEELAINLRSDGLDRNLRSYLDLRRASTK